MSSLFIGIPHLPSRKERMGKLLPALPIAPFVLTNQCAKHEIGPYLWKQAFLSGADHAVFMDDDAILCPHFAEVLPKVIAARPNDILCLYSMSVFAPALWDFGDRWHASTDMFVGVGGVIPRKLLPDLIEFETGIDKADPNVARSNHDAWVSMFARWKNLPIWHTLPSLVDHPPPIQGLKPKQAVLVDPDEPPPIASAFGNVTPPATVAFGSPIKSTLRIRCERPCEGYPDGTPHLHIRHNPYAHHVRVRDDPRGIDWTPTGGEEQLGDHYVPMGSDPWEEQGTRAMVVSHMTDEWRRAHGTGMFMYETDEIGRRRNAPVKPHPRVYNPFLDRELGAGRRVNFGERPLPYPHGQPPYMPIISAAGK